MAVGRPPALEGAQVYVPCVVGDSATSTRIAWVLEHPEETISKGAVVRPVVSEHIDPHRELYDLLVRYKHDVGLSPELEQVQLATSTHRNTSCTSQARSSRSRPSSPSRGRRTYQEAALHSRTSHSSLFPSRRIPRRRSFSAERT